MSFKKLLLVPIGLVLSIAGCAGIGPNATYYMGTTTFGYGLLYTPYDLKLNGTEIGIGGMNTSPVKLGPQKIIWRDANTGEVHMARNEVVLTKEQLKGKKYLALHLYPDESVEIITSMNWPDETEKGLKWREKIRNQNK